MTFDQALNIADLLGYSDEVAARGTGEMECAPLMNNLMMVISKEENLYSDINRWRYKFNEDTELLERYFVRIYSFDVTDLPESGNYDIYKVSDIPYNEKYEDAEWVVFEYITDKSGHIICDFYDVDMLAMFIPLANNNKTTLFVEG